MKKIFIFFILLINVPVPFNLYSENIHKSVIRVGVYNNPPKISVSEEGKISGYHIDILDEIKKISSLSEL